jgi:cytochrome c-type biogenesis protein CcmH
VTGSAATDWIAPATVVLAALIVGLVLIWRIRAAARGGAVTAAPAESLERRDLLGKRDALLAQLRELEDTAAKRTPAQLARERYDLELEAARAWMALDALPDPATARPPLKKKTAAPAPAESAATTTHGSALRGFAWGVGTMAALALLLFWVSRAVKPREEGGQLTGNLPTQEDRGAEPDADEAALRATVARNPEDLDARLDLARLHLGRREMMAVWEETQFVLKRSPGHPRALAYQALVRLAMGQADVAESLLTQAIASAPDLIEARLHLALVYADTGRVPEAEKVIAEALRRFPEHKEGLERVARELRARAADAPSPAAADRHPPVPAPGAAEPTAADAGPRLDVEVDLDPSLRGSVRPGTVLFVTVRDAGMDVGPPRAVKRVAAASFPVRLTLTESDSMAGEPIPDTARVEARLDGDGDAMTRSPDDPNAVQDDVKTGKAPVRLLLRRAR